VTSRTCLVVLLVLSLLLCLPSVALARSQDPDNPEILRPDEPLTGMLPGAPAGSFAFFAVDYPGGDQELVIRMTPRPADPSESNCIALNIYGPNGFIGSSRTAQEADPSVRVFRYHAAEPVRLLVQLYNYTLKTTIQYTIVASGFTEMAEAPAPEPEPTPEPPPALPETRAAAGTLVGSPAGAFANPTLSYPGDGSDVTVRVTFSTDNPAVADALGFQVYSPEGRVVARSTTTSTPGERRATFASSTAGSYTIQIYNYADGLMVSYSAEW